MITRATDELVIDSKLLATLCEATDNPGHLQYLWTLPEPPQFGSPEDVGCIYYINEGNARERDIPVDLKHKQGKATASVARVSFAAARKNWSRGLSRKEHAAHLCGAERIENGKRMPCINPGHLVRVSAV
jgi:hypothetical protein